jgi:hypothetical protein
MIDVILSRAHADTHSAQKPLVSLSLSRSFFFFLFFPFGSVLFDDGGNVKEFRARQRWARCSTFGRLWNRKKRKKGNENKIKKGKKTTTKRNGSSPFLHNATRNVCVCVCIRWDMSDGAICSILSTDWKGGKVIRAIVIQPAHFHHSAEAKI